MGSARSGLTGTLTEVARTAARLCEAQDCLIFLIDGPQLRLAAKHGSLRYVGVPPLSQASVVGRAILKRQTVHVKDLTIARRQFASSPAAQAPFVRTIVATPLLVDGTAVGGIVVRRTRVRPFSAKQLALLKTFADQAAIAIENARLAETLEARHRELTTALERETATGEILRVISSSPTNTEPVFNTILASACRLCEANIATLFLFDGEYLCSVAHHNASPAFAEHLRRSRLRPSHETSTRLAALQRRVVHIHDLLTDPAFAPSDVHRQEEVRTVLSVPLLRDTALMGVLTVWRREVRPFTDRHVTLLQTFADQAVIAIENVRLFNELQARNRALTEALDQQTATSEILGVISSSPLELTPVFDSLLDNALRLCGAETGILWLWDEPTASFRPTAMRGAPDAYAEFIRRTPVQPAPDTGLGRIATDRRTVHIADVAAEELYRQRDPLRVATVEILGARTFLAVPMLRENALVGTFTVYRQRVEPFSERQVALIQTFADQAVIAIENVRLFTELQTKNEALTQAHAQVTEALEQQTATGEILRVISSSPTDVQPVFDAIAESSARLCGALFSSVYQFDGELIHMRAHHNYPPIALERSRQFFPTRPTRQLFTARAILDRSVVHVPDVEHDTEYAALDFLRDAGFRAVLSVPMLREGRPIGAITVWRAAAGSFPDKQIASLKIFADQAVIAIENVRLFTELQARNRELTIALDQQTATSEILRVISQSHTDTQPVFDSIIRSAVRLCEGTWGSMVRVDGDTLNLWAHHNYPPEVLALVTGRYPAPVSESSLVGLAVRTRALVHSPAALADPRFRQTAYTQALGVRAQVTVPLLRNGEALGTLNVLRNTPGPFTEGQIALLQTFADQAVIAIENVRLFNELQTRNRELTVALDQQTATSEILRVISSSPTDVRPVFTAIADNAARLCEAFDAIVLRVDGDTLRLVAHHGPMPAGDVPLHPGTLGGRTVLERRLFHIEDLQAAAHEFPEGSAIALQRGHRTTLSVPLLREGVAIGNIQLRRNEVRPFSDQQIALLQTFADQAVIAIENVRLFTELQARNRDLTDALEQQTATAEVLRVISRSPTDVAPVFDAILASATRLCSAQLAVLWLHEGDNLFRAAAFHGASPQYRTWLSGSAHRVPPALFRPGGPWRPAHIEDAAALPYLDSHPLIRASVELEGMRTLLGVPLVKDDQVVGGITIYRREVARFSDQHVALVQTFADQAVIAIENVRLFTELQASNRELSQALAQQTAISEVLQVISRSVFDLQTVLQTLVDNATRLCGAEKGFIFRRVGDVYRLAVDHGAEPDYRAFIAANPITPSRATLVGRVVLESRAVHIPDAVADPEYGWRESQQRGGFRTMLGVPMLREGMPIGVIAMWKERVEPFTDAQIDLVTTFANQAVIAIENARLVSELQTRTQELTRSVGQLTALGEVGQAVSSTLDLETVLQTICVRAAHLAGADVCTVSEYDQAAEEFHLRATHNLDEEFVAVARRTPIRKGDGVQGRMAITRQPVQIPDIAAADAYRGPFRDVLLRAGTRAVLTVPLLRENLLIGALTINKKTPGEFPPETVALLKTFATQSAIAIQNARLFREIEDKSRQLETASKHKSQFLANMSHELRTPLNAILGYTELIADKIYGEVPERMQEVLERVDKSGRHLLGLINDILDLSKIEAGQLTLALSDYSMADVVQSVAVSVEALAREKKLELAVTVDPDLPLGRGDPRRLTQVVLNLVGNALKFTDAGQVAVRARHADDAFLVEVADTGPGIGPDDQAKIFEEFQQADSATVRAKGGTGLGLAIARRIVEMHGGRMWVESMPGRGSTFSFTVPSTAQ